MKRFHFGDNEEEEDEDEENENFKPEFFSMSQFPIETGNHVLDSAIKICENSFFWKFYSINFKLHKIKKVYEFLILLEEGENNAEI